MSEHTRATDLKHGGIYYFQNNKEEPYHLFLNGQWHKRKNQFSPAISVYNCVCKGNIFSLLDTLNERGEET